jgi:hypothetical protein
MKETYFEDFSTVPPYLRPLMDKIDEPPVPVTITLKHLQGNLLDASLAKTLNRKEFKCVSRCGLEAMKTLHEDSLCTQV